MKKTQMKINASVTYKYAIRSCLYTIWAMFDDFNLHRNYIGQRRALYRFYHFSVNDTVWQRQQQIPWCMDARFCQSQRRFWPSAAQILNVPE